jgi:hypothetical protein
MEELRERKDHKPCGITGGAHEATITPEDEYKVNGLAVTRYSCSRCGCKLYRAFASEVTIVHRRLHSDYDPLAVEGAFNF